MISFFIGLVSAAAAALGFGSGCVMLICLGLQGVERLAASGLNLLFFPLSGGVALLLHNHRGLVCRQTALSMLWTGCVGALAGSWAACLLPQPWLSRFFGLLLLVLSAKELAGCFKNSFPLHKPPPRGTN